MPRFAPYPASRHLGAACLLVVCALVLGGCQWRRTRMWPRPMTATADPLPPGDLFDHPAGPEEVSILRHADPVRVRPAGSRSGYPLAFYAKRTRLTAGGSVIVAPGGRAEVLWPSGSSIVLFGQGIGWVGSPSRGEPIFEFQEIERGRLDLMPGDRVELVGGSVITGDSGPYMVDRIGEETLRLRNQSKSSLQFAFREEVYEVDPGQSILIPLLTSGGQPRSAGVGLQRVSGPGFALDVRGPLDLEPGPDSVGARAQAGGGERELRGLGVRVRLPDGEQAVFSGLGVRAATPAAPSGPDPADVQRLEAEIAAQEALQQGLQPGDPTYDQAQVELERLRAELDALRAPPAPNDGGA